MKIAIVYVSYYRKHTKKIIEAMNKVLKADLYEVNDTLIWEKQKKYDLIGLGSGIYFAKHHKQILELASLFPDLSGKMFFIFCTRCNIRLGKYHDKLRNILIEKGGCIVDEFSCRAYDATGPFRYFGGMNKYKPNEKDLWKAEEFARKLLRKCTDKVHFSDENLISRKIDGKIIRGDYNPPSILGIQGDKVWVNLDVCNGCGKCVKVCPVNVYKLSKFKGHPVSELKAIPVNELDCIQCLLCVENCPFSAIHINGNIFDAFRMAWKHGKRE